jgi:beta-xylosidase
MANKSRAIMKFLTIIGFTFTYPSSYGQVWIPDNGDGTYRNPVIFADYSDPDVIRVGDDFIMTASSFNCVPGLPILRSPDLVNWTIAGYAIPDPLPADVYAKPQHGNGVWAPGMRYHGGEYFIYYGDPDFGIYLVKAKDPAGPWSKPQLVKSAVGWIDPCPFWDDDDNAYLIHAWAKSRSGINSILTMHKMNTEGTKILDDGITVFDGRERQPTIEGPKMYKRAGYYYIFAPAGGVKNGWQTVLRSKSIYGPYEDKIVLAQGSTGVNGPHQGAWVQLASGDSWFLHFQDRGAYGRIVHLQPMEWKDGWPVIGADTDGDGKCEPVATYTKPNVGKSFPVAIPQTSDEFNEEKIGLQWQWHAKPDSTWGWMEKTDGNLRLNAIGLPRGFRNFWDVSNLLLQKLCAPEYTATVKMNCNFAGDGEKTGLIVMGTDYSYVAVRSENDRLSLVQTTCLGADSGSIEVEGNPVPLEDGNLYLRITIANDANCTFSYSTDGDKFIPLGASFTAKPGKWIGAKVGLFCIRNDDREKTGYAKYDYFRVEKLN